MENRVIERLRAEAGEQVIKLNEPMAAHTTFRIGGPADVFMVPENEDQAAGDDWHMQGREGSLFSENGSNLLVGAIRDSGAL